MVRALIAVVLVGCGFTGSPDPDPLAIDARTVDAAIDAREPDASIADTFVIEAEAFDASEGSAASHQWMMRTDQAMYTGASFMQLLPANGGSCSNPTQLDPCAASLTYNVTITTPGMYHFYVRILSTLSDEDTIWVGVDGTVRVPHIDQMENGTWKWERGGAFTVDAGNHTLHLWQREAGVRVDAIAFTTRATWP